MRLTNIKACLLGNNLRFTALTVAVATVLVAITENLYICVLFFNILTFNVVQNLYYKLNLSISSFNVTTEH